MAMDFELIAQVSTALLIAGAVLLLLAWLLRALSVRSSVVLALLNVPGVGLVSAGILGGCLLLFNLVGIFVWLIVMGFGYRAAVHRRAARRHNLFAALTLAAERGLPLSPMASAVAAEESDRFARLTRKLADRLQWGASLTDVAPLSSRVLPSDALLAAHVGAKTGDLSSAMRAATCAVHFDRSVLQPVIARFIYMFLVGLYVIGFVSFLMIKVAPSYVKIFEDFDEPLPVAFSFSTFAFDTLSILAVPLVAGIVALMIYTWLQWRGTMYPRLPGLRRVINWVDMAPALRLLSLAVRQRRSLVEIFSSLAVYHPKFSVRDRASRVLWDIDDGQDWAESLRVRRMLEPADAAVLRGPAQRKLELGAQ